MLKIEVDKGQTSIAMEGFLFDIIADTGAAIDSIYKRLLEKNSAVADLFKKSIKSLAADDDSPMWEREKAAPAEPEVKIGVVNVKGCKTEDDAQRMILEALKNMGVPAEVIAKFAEEQRK